MTDERRYDEEELREIFEAASAPAETGRHAVARRDGLTLSELQAIAREVGLDPERVAEAAIALDRRAVPAPRRTHLGMPIAVGRAVALPRAPTDREWQLLLAELRETFHAQGRDESSGGIRHWRNGNLHAFVEPTESGYRLRLGTQKGDATSVTMVGAVGVGMGLLASLGAFVDGKLAKGLIVLLMLGGMGAAALIVNAIRLPRWAREREEQMAYIEGRTRALIGPGSPGDDS